METILTVFLQALQLVAGDVTFNQKLMLVK